MDRPRLEVPSTEKPGGSRYPQDEPVIAAHQDEVKLDRGLIRQRPGIQAPGWTTPLWGDAKQSCCGSPEDRNPLVII